MNATTKTTAGSYKPNAAGARTLADARPLYIGDHRVTAEVSETGHYTVFIGCKIAAEGELTGSEGELNSFFRELALAASEETAEQVEVQTPSTPVVAWSTTVEADGEETDLYEANAADHRAAMTAQIQESIAVCEERLAKGDPRFKNNRRILPGDPRHPANALVSYREALKVAEGWTAQDEASYSRYVDNGISGTDGYYAPISRIAWKGTLGQ